MEQHSSTELLKQCVNHALKAYRLEVHAEVALSGLSNERLTPPATRLLMAMLGAIGSKHPGFHKKVLMTTEELVC